MDNANYKALAVHHLGYAGAQKFELRQMIQLTSMDGWVLEGFAELDRAGFAFHGNGETWGLTVKNTMRTGFKSLPAAMAAAREMVGERPSPAVQSAAFKVNCSLHGPARGKFGFTFITTVASDFIYHSQAEASAAAERTAAKLKESINGR